MGKNKTKNIGRKAQMGVDTAKAVVLSVFGLVLLAILGIILMGSLNDTPVATTSGTINPTTETLTTVNELPESFTVTTLRNCAITVSSAMNQTGGNTIPASNYTVSGCTIRFNTGQGNANGYNNTNWVVNYSGTFNSFGSISSNLTTGTASFFSNVNVWFALLSVTIVILIITIVIFAVQRFGARANSGF